MKFHSTAPNGHYRAGRHVTAEGVDIDIAELSADQLDAIANDSRLVKPAEFSEAYAAAKEAAAKDGKTKAKAK
jgi:hypothetical protein